MPRGRSSRGGGSAAKSPQALLRGCLDALLQDSDPIACMGNELECACCVGSGGLSSDVVDSLCAFCLHSEAARQFFVNAGGLDALLLAGRSQTEGSVSNALQVLQCLSVSADSQHLVLSSKPQLLLLVSHLAASDAAQWDREGLQHAALCLLGSWVQDHGSPFSVWVLQQRVVRQPGGSIWSKSGAVQSLGSSSKAGATQPLLIHVSMRALTHPSLVLRKAAARLFASVAAAAFLQGAPSAPPPARLSQDQAALCPDASTHPLADHPLASACLHDASALAQQLQDLLQTAASCPCFEEFAALGQADPAAFMVRKCVCLTACLAYTLPEPAAIGQGHLATSLETGKPQIKRGPVWHALSGELMGP